MRRRYKGAIWTNHAIERLNQRGLTQAIAAQAFKYPDKVFSGKEAGVVEYRKRFKNSLVTVIAKKNEKEEWIILSCWIDPPMQGTEDEKKQRAYREYHRAGFWGKIWMVTKKLLGFGY